MLAKNGRLAMVTRNVLWSACPPPGGASRAILYGHALVLEGWHLFHLTLGQKINRPRGREMLLLLL